MTVSVFVGASVDGFIARPNHDLDWLPADGGETIQSFLRAGLVDRFIITRVPVLIGEGIPLFGALPRDVRLGHVSTRSFPTGLVQSEYQVLH